MYNSNPMSTCYLTIAGLRFAMFALDITITKVDIAIITAIKGNLKFHQVKH